MEIWKANLREEMKKRYNGADPTILCISQDLTKPKRKENKKGTVFNQLMLNEMKSIHAMAALKFVSNDYFNCRNLKYTMSPETVQKW